MYLSLKLRPRVLEYYRYTFMGTFYACLMPRFALQYRVNSLHMEAIAVGTTYNHYADDFSSGRVVIVFTRQTKQ